jgi:hypothetical protein
MNIQYSCFEVNGIQRCGHVLANGALIPAKLPLSFRNETSPVEE